MRMAAFISTFIGLGLGVLLSPAWGATVSVIGGSVLINQGSGFRSITGTVQAKAGDAVMVRPGGSAQVVYPDGCPFTVNPGEVVTIAPASPCTAFAQLAPGDPVAPPLNDDGINWYLVGGGAALLVGGGVGLYYLLKDKDSSPATGLTPSSP